MSRIAPRAAAFSERPAFAERPAPADGISLAQVPALLRRSWHWIAVPTLVVAGLSTVFVQVVSPRYTGEAKLLLESREAAFARTATERAEQVPPIDEQAVASQVQVMMSRDLAREAIRRLNLVGNPEFDPSAGTIGPVQRTLMMLGLAKNPLDRPAEDRVLEAYFERLLVFPAGKSRILSVEFRAKDAELAAKGANTVAELYIAALEAAKVDTARYASTWLGGNIDSLRKRVAEAEARVEAYRAGNGLVGSTGATGQPLNAQQLGELSSQLSQARILKADLAGRAKAVKEMIKDGRAFEIPDVANNEVIRRTVENRITIRGQLALESRTLLPAHPRIKELTAQLQDLDAQIKASAERVGRTLENDAKIAASRVESLQAAVDGQRDVVVKGNTSEIQLRALEREAKVQREQLESYLSRYREAAARDGESATPADARIISRAVTPEIPSFPKKLPIVAFATLLTLMLAAGAVIARHLLSDPTGGGRREREAVAADAHATAERPERFAFPEAVPPAHWAAAEIAPRAAAPRFADPAFPEPASAGRASAHSASAEAPAEEAEAAPEPVLPVAATPEPAPPRAAAFDLAPLIARLEAGPRAGSGRTLLVVETAGPGRPAAGPSLVEAIEAALSGRASALSVDLNGPASDADAPGLTDLVAGEAAFLDVIQAERGSGLHRIAAGSLETEVLLEEPDAVAITVEAMAEAYDWVVCRLRAEPGAHALLPALGGLMDSVIIASNAALDDPDLGDLFASAEDSGAGQVLVAQDRPAQARAVRTEPMALRLSAA
ncbi:GumC family protein [Methylobacterium sp. J-092]|uniref:GumC family protein n=1 Tax=Methylobacterium sp. J-092 TaxID=2836667 RepID=UPI001FB9C532|nr:GumC family protein [Methylobacterium sp. J-092]MCJ2008037.1 GumC family protein [Methylobacterium sp. J-092]